MKAPAYCHLEEAARETLDLSANMARSLRKLRRAMDACDHCSLVNHCDTILAFGTIVRAAIDEVIDEWNLTAL